MGDMTVSLIVVGVSVVVVICIFWLTARVKKQKIARIRTLTQEKGWQFEVIKQRLREGYQIKGANWRMQAIKEARGQSVEPQQSNIASETCFMSESLYLPGRNLLIGPRAPEVNLGPFGEMLKEKLMFKVMGESAKGMQEVKVGSAPFNQHFMVLANDTRDAEKLLSPLSEQLLVEFSTKKPVVKVTQAGLEVKLDGAYLDKDGDITRFIELGEALVEAG